MERITLRVGSERAQVYPEGGIAFACYVDGIGWTVDEAPSAVIQAAAVAVRGEAFPHLAPLSLAELAAA